MADHDCCWYSRSARLSDGHLSGTSEKVADLYEYLRKKLSASGYRFHYTFEEALADWYKDDGNLYLQ